MQFSFLSTPKTTSTASALTSIPSASATSASIAINANQVAAATPSSSSGLSTLQAKLPQNFSLGGNCNERTGSQSPFDVQLPLNIVKAITNFREKYEKVKAAKVECLKNIEEHVNNKSRRRLDLNELKHSLCDAQQSIVPITTDIVQLKTQMKEIKKRDDVSAIKELLSSPHGGLSPVENYCLIQAGKVSARLETCQNLISQLETRMQKNKSQNAQQRLASDLRSLYCRLVKAGAVLQDIQNRSNAARNESYLTTSATNTSMNDSHNRTSLCDTTWLSQLD